MERILVVEDEHIVALDIKMHLQKYGYEVPVTYPTGEEALANIEALKPVLVLMDIRLAGEMDGLQAAEEIKRKHNIPVILLTAYADESTIERAKASQPFAYLIKPFEERELRTAIVLALYRHQMEQELIRRERLFSTTLNSIADGVVVVDNEGRISFANPVALNLMRVSEEACVGKEYQRVVALDRRVIADLGSEELHVLRAAEDEWIPVEYEDAPLIDEQGSRAGTVLVFRDISQRLTTEHALSQSLEQFRQAQKMEAVGRLSGGIAHDFNNLLTVIMGYSRLIRQELDHDFAQARDAILADLEGLDRAAQRSANLTRQLLAFSRRQILQPKIYNLNEVVQDMEKMFRRLLTEKVRMYLSCRAEHASVLVDHGQIEQVLMNLIVNARDAMPEGGTLTVRTRTETVTEHLVCATGTIPPGDYVVIAVQDTGVGIGPENVSRIFEPFFTTKETAQGTGLGLSTVYGIVRQTNGHIDVNTILGVGTTFSVFLPVQGDAPEKAEEAPEIANRPLGGNETLMLVEDDEPIRKMLSRVLRDSGYTVIEAENAGEALLIAEDSSVALHLLVTDVVMPHVSGDKLAQRLRAERPEIRALLISGYPDAVAQDWVGDFGAELLLKPFDPDVLVAKVRELLDR